MRPIGRPSAVVNMPPAYSAGPLPSSKTVRAPSPPVGPFTPLPSGDQFDPFHIATLIAALPPAFRNKPRAYSAGPLPSSNTVKASTLSSIPAPSADQLEP